MFYCAEDGGFVALRRRLAGEGVSSGGNCEGESRPVSRIRLIRITYSRRWLKHPG